MRRILAAALVSLLACGPASAVAAAAAPSLTTIERQVMCVTCKIPLNVAQSTQAGRERSYISQLIAEGRGERQIKDALVAQYGPSVLGLPADNGFDATVYIVPIAVVVALAALLAFLLPRWRRREPAPAASGVAGEITQQDAARLDADMARFD